MAIFGYAGHCVCVGSNKFRLSWATHGWPRNKGNVEPCWAKSLTSFKFDSTRLKTAQELSTGCSNALNLLRACTVDKSSAFARGLRSRRSRGTVSLVTCCKLSPGFGIVRLYRSIEAAISYTGVSLGPRVARSTLYQVVTPCGKLLAVFLVRCWRVSQNFLSLIQLLQLW